ncbi:copper resistance CopC family protein [Oceanobacillus piezotolerans]|uniref:copper resistance CopC family protein n=1 Tax=Oceanobacillus piezotolerans TaxID=2448030 RepID=UPI001314175F|nr:copper resistance protein CopC [Oceanobacillus piezotolerans]
MKRIFITAITVLLVTCFSNSAFAHSNFQGSNPADGEVVTEPIQEIILEFNGQIEQGSFIEVTTTEGQAVETQDIMIGEGALTGTFAEPLANDDYQVSWSIISADGHPLEGEFFFTVNADAPDAQVEETEDSAGTETVEEEETEQPSETDTVENEESTESAEQVNSEEGSSSMLVIIMITLVIIIIAGLFLLNKRKRK